MLPNERLEKDFRARSLVSSSQPFRWAANEYHGPRV
jgi:hypothetical protein